MQTFMFVEVPSFQMQEFNEDGLLVDVVYPPQAMIGKIMKTYHEVRRGLWATSVNGFPVDMVARGRGIGRQRFWTANDIPDGGMHAERQMMTNYSMFTDHSIGRPDVLAVLLRDRPCDVCMEYFKSNGQGQIRLPGGPEQQYINVRFAPYDFPTPVFYLGPLLHPLERGNLWIDLETMWPSGYTQQMAWNPYFDQGTVCFLTHQWYSINGQERMSDSEIVQCIQDNGLQPGYWIGRAPAP